jgi:hypothetical protein
MVFANTATLADVRASVRQRPVHAMRTRRVVPIEEVTRRTGLPVAEVRRYNPALVRQVPAGAQLYLPAYVKEFGEDVAFWHREPGAAFSAALADFLAIDAPPAAWDQPSFTAVLTGFEQRFRRTASEEGSVMATVLAYVIADIRTSRRGALLADFRASPAIAGLLARAVTARDQALVARSAAAADRDAATRSR